MIPCLNGHDAAFISASLDDEDVRQWQPVALRENSGRSFKGVDFGGVGFLLSKEEASAICIESPTEAIHVWPVMNAATLMASPRLESGQSIINFTGLTLDEAQKNKLCLGIVRERVLPVREKAKRKANRERWWLYNETRPGLYGAIRQLKQVLVNPVVSKWIAFCLLPSRTVFTNVLNIYPFDDMLHFAVLQARSHEIWAVKYGSTLRVDTRYNPTDCFETFPFPKVHEQRKESRISENGRLYYDYRAALMIRNDEGLTTTYNRFHDPDETSPEILELRRLHAAMDHAVLTAYGWDDLAAQATCEFQLDYEEPEDEDDEASGRKRKKKKPWRYKWPQALHDEVLARLLELNQQYAEAERLAGESAGGKAKASKKKTAKKKTSKKNASKKKAVGEQTELLGRHED